jgi:uncharacterized protein YecT (DUF1311 family)
MAIPRNADRTYAVKIAIGIVLINLLLLTSVQAASFDCMKAQSRVERLICGDKALSKLDETMSASYASALHNGAQSAETKKAQRQWLVERNRCLDADCVRSSYENRLKMLSGDGAASALRCGDPSAAGFGRPVRTYLMPHKVYEATEGMTAVNDILSIWDKEKTSDSTCFKFETVHTHLHLCWLVGEAKRVGPNVYEYADAACRIRMTHEQSRVRVEVDDPSEPGRKFCNPADTDEYSCGSNTGIEPGLFYAK